MASRSPSPRLSSGHPMGGGVSETGLENVATTEQSPGVGGGGLLHPAGPHSRQPKKQRAGRHRAGQNDELVSGTPSC